MPYNIYKVLDNDITISAGQSKVLDIDTGSIENIQVMVSATFANTASSTGVGLELFYGLGRPDPEAIYGYIVEDPGVSSTYATFSDNFDTVAMESFTASSSSPQTKITVFNIEVKKLPRWLRFKFTNNDVTNSCTISVKADQ